MRKTLWQAPQWRNPEQTVNLSNTSLSLSEATAEAAPAKILISSQHKGIDGNDLPMHVMTAVNSLRELKRTLSLIEDEATSLEIYGQIWRSLIQMLLSGRY